MGLAVTTFVFTKSTQQKEEIKEGFAFSNFHLFCQAYSEMIAERRKSVTDGAEDTFGLGRGNDVNST